jgi:hypothetical protein
MTPWLINYLRERKFLLISLHFFSAFTLFAAVYFITQKVTHTEDSYYYYNDAVINSINSINLVCLSIVFLLFTYKILFELKVIKFDIPKINNLILMVIGGFIVALLIWYEFYYVTLFYHGEVRVLSGYLIGSSILVSISLTIFLSSKFKNITILFGVFAALAYFFYECQVLILAKYVDIMNITF